MKKIFQVFSSLMITVILFGNTVFASGANEIKLQINNPVMTVNGVEQEIDEGRETTPITVSDRTLVPIRAIIEAMGGTVSYDENTQTILLEYNNNSIRLSVDSTTAYFNETVNTLDVAPTVINERTMLPIRFIAEKFGFNVVWNDDTSEITITSINEENDENNGAITISKQGNFAAGGTIATNDGEFDGSNVFSSYAGQTIHGDHATVFYQIPSNAKKYNMVFLHGNGQSARCWGTTPDGREGFQSLFLRKGYGVYLVDQPRRGQASQSTQEVTVKPDFTDQMRFEQFRLGIWPNFYEGVSFPQDEESINQFYRLMTPSIGYVPSNVSADAFHKIFEKSGPSVFVTHSAGGGMGWNMAMTDDNVKAVVALEPGSFVFPESDAPEPIENLYVNSGVPTVPDEEFDKLTKIPIIVYFGDNIPKTHSEHPGEDFWYATREMGYKFAEAVNSRGGDVTIVDMPAEGMHGNTHFIFSDLNNAQVADHISNWLHNKGLE